MRRVTRHLDSLVSALMLAAVLLVVSGTASVPGCAASGTVIRVTRECGVEAGRDLVPRAVLEIETAVAQASPVGALAALEALGAQYGVAFVTCVVERVVRDSGAALARNAGEDAAREKFDNGTAWLQRHPRE